MLIRVFPRSFYGKADRNSAEVLKQVGKLRNLEVAGGVVLEDKVFVFQRYRLVVFGSINKFHDAEQQHVFRDKRGLLL